MHAVPYVLRTWLAHVKFPLEETDGALKYLGGNWD
jgi:hypothetical protein